MRRSQGSTGIRSVPSRHGGEMCIHIPPYSATNLDFSSYSCPLPGLCTLLFCPSPDLRAAVGKLRMAPYRVNPCHSECSNSEGWFYKMYNSSLHGTTKSFVVFKRSRHFNLEVLTRLSFESCGRFIRMAKSHIRVLQHVQPSSARL